jgi:hypothetical protein
VTDSFTLLGALQRFLEQRRVVVETLTIEPAILLLLDWFRLVPADGLIRATSADVLVYRYGGWSEGCATAYNFSLLRRVTQQHEAQKNELGETVWFAGITLMFEPSGRADLEPFQTTSADAESIDAFLAAIEDSAGFKALRREQPMGVVLESGGLR